MAKQTYSIYQIKVTLKDIHPPIWRRIQVPSNTTLLRLHDILQIVMGWMDSHMHVFTIDGKEYGDPANDEFGEFNIHDEMNNKLNKVIRGKGHKFFYEYDFGDSWEHVLLIEKVSTPEDGVRYPMCLAGKGACPPEDVGGVWGYREFLKALNDPYDSEHDEYMEWIGGEFDPKAFDLEEVNTSLYHVGQGRSAEWQNVWSPPDEQASQNLTASANIWLRKLTDKQQAIAENLPLRIDAVSLLTYLRDNRIIGTQSTGNLPLKAVNEICKKFVNPPILEETVGDYTFRARSESSVWPLFFRHLLAFKGGLTTGGLGRRWRLTSLGEKFLASPTSIQVWVLWATWWTQIDWAIALSSRLEIGFLPDDYPSLALKHLLDLSPETSTSFKRFADRLIEDTGLIWPIEDQDFAQNILRSMVENSVIDPLVDFGVVEADYKADRKLGERYRELIDFRITSFGKELLERMREATNQRVS